MPRRRSNVVLPYNLGLYLDRSPISVPSGGLQDGRNFRIRKGRVSNANMGWTNWSNLLGTNDSFTKILIHANGVDGSVEFQDAAFGYTHPAYRIWTANGNAQVDTAVSKFGGGSLLCDGTGDFLSIADSADYALGTSNWTLETWFNCNAAGGTAQRIGGQIDAGFTAAGSSIALYRETTNVIRLAVSNGSSFTTLDSVSTFTNAVNTGFNHVAAVRSGNTLLLFINGVLQASTSFSASIPNSAANFGIGALGSYTGEPWTGWIDEFRLSVGIARYTANFTPAVGPFQRVLSGPVMLIEEFASRGQPTTPVIATTRDLYAYNQDTDTFRLITPIYTTATVDVTAANPAVVNVNTGVPNWVTTGIKAGDFIRFGTTTENDPDAPWYQIAVVNSNTQLTLTTVVTGAPLTNVTYTIRRRYTGTTVHRWDTDTFVEPNDGTGNDMIFLTNGLEDVTTWTQQTAFALLRPTLGFKAKQLRIFKSMMLYGNLTIAGVSNPTTFINSDVGIPLEVVNGLAGEFKVHDGVDEIFEMEDLGDNMVFYSARHLTLCQFVGDPLVFIFRQASTGIGPIGPELVADFGDYHEFIGADSQYLFDGVSVTEIGTQVWREVLRQRDASRQELGFLHFDEENGDLIWAIPLASDSGLGDLLAPPEEAFVEHYLEIDDERISDPFSRRAMPFVCGGYSVSQDVFTWNEVEGTWQDNSSTWDASALGAAFPLNLMGGEDGFIYVINTSQTGDGVVLPSWVRGGRIATVDGKTRGLCRRIYPFVSPLTGNLQVISRYVDHASGDITATEQNLMDLTLPQEGHFVTPYRRGRFYEVEFRRDDGNTYVLEGYDIDVIPDGGER